eukprot:1431603-Rhodomonas_salina.4
MSCGRSHPPTLSCYACPMQYPVLTSCYHIMLGVPYAVSGTDLGYAATRRARRWPTERRAAAGSPT